SSAWAGLRRASTSSRSSPSRGRCRAPTSRGSISCSTSSPTRRSRRSSRWSRSTRRRSSCTSRCSLFRRRGEYDRAIRMHQNLLERADLGAEQKVIALAELGQDYLKAGILDRAEQVFKRLSDGPQAIQARRHLLQIFEQEKDWPRAIEM